MLIGKGVWAAYGDEIDLAIRMAQAIDATHVLFRTGRGTDYFETTAPTAFREIRDAGLVPFGWPFILCDDPAGEAEVAVRTWQEGYEGIVFDIEDQAAGKAANAAELGRRLIEDEGLDPNDLYFTSFPNVSDHSTIPYKEMAALCKGGFMPQCYGTFRWPAHHVLETMTYQEYENWPAGWGDRPAIYPILGAYYDFRGEIRMALEEFHIWANELAKYRPTFYSIYRAEVTNEDLWPILKDLHPWRPVTEADWMRASQQAWSEVSVAFDPNLAFPRKAQEVLGPNAFALSTEHRSAINDHVWAWQLWSDGDRTVILLTLEGEWGLADIRAIAYPGE
jgi:hypothetical protein